MVNEHDIYRETAGQGLKLMFTGQVVAVAAVVVVLVSMFGGLLTPLAAFFGVLMLVSALATLAGAIISLVGLVKCRNAHRNYLYAICVLVGGILLSLLLRGVDLGVAEDVVSAVCRIAQTYLICTATDDLVWENVIRPSGALTWKICAAGELLNVLGTVLSAQGNVAPGLLASVGALVIGVIYMVFLYRASARLMGLADEAFRTLG